MPDTQRKQNGPGEKKTPDGRKNSNQKKNGSRNSSSRNHPGKKRSRKNRNTQANSRPREKDNDKKNRGSEKIRPPRQKKPLYCESCGKAITNAASAMRDPENSGFLHFDCVIRLLEEKEKLLPQQKIMYIGHGEFAVAETGGNRNSEFTIVRKIPYETAEMKKSAKIEIMQYIDVVDV